MSSHRALSSKIRSHQSLVRNTDHNIRVFGYCRVSTDMQVQHGLSLDAQRAEIERYAADRGWVVEEIFVDGGFSAKNTDRPAFQRMTKAIKDSDGAISAVLVTKLDRLTRSLRDLCSINEDLLDPYGCNLVAIRDGINTFEPVSKMLLPFLAIIGQIERQNTGERVRATIQHIREQGGHYGKVPFGFSTIKDGRLRRLVPDPETHPWLEKAIAWYREGVGMAEIAQRLNAAGIRPRYGKRVWDDCKIYELLRTMKIHKTRAVMSDARFDKREAYKLAYKLRSEGKTHGAIADALNAAGLRPLKAAHYRWNSVQDLLRSAVYHDRSTPRGLALYLKEQGHSLREIGLRLAQSGHFPKRGGQWYPNTVRLLMVS
ncbi:MAG TPA: recombinase family protein [Pseudomonadota bacterium]|nr:recombinase family protein [Pseudomonadota bacterium]